MSNDSDELDPTRLPSTETAGAASGDRQQIGPYRILQKIGEGGMGEVYEAEQEKPVRRKVALKLIKWGMDTKQVVGRFESERQALALMNHPAIAKVLDAGATEQGRPYFAMEYVKGEPITKYCDKHRLNNRERLDLFMQVCEGVQHAHQKGIIHRDLKPTNVLVAIQDDKPVPKIIDFGVAKATEQRLTEKTVFTQMGMLVGTPEYMSPEQAEMTGLDIDTRTDVYSLGVMLYELLIGALPFESKELRQAGFDELRRRIREDEPSRPSTKLRTLGDASTVSANKRRTDPVSLAKQLRGDLDWITMKAIEKDRTRRYGSPSELAADIERHLKDEPVQASPPSATYRAGKYVRRHRFGVVAAATGVVVLIGLAATMAVQARRIASERDRAEQARADLESVVEFQSGMLSEMDTEGMGRRLMEDLKSRVGEASRARGLSGAETDAVVTSFDDAVRGVNATDAALRLIDQEILARAVETLEEEFAERPLIDAHLRKTIGITYTNLGLYPAAEPQQQRALETHKRVLGDEHPKTLESMNNLARLYWLQGRSEEAEALFLEALETSKRVLGDDHLNTLDCMNNLALLYRSQGRYDEAEPLHLKTLEIRKRVLGDDHPKTLESMNNLARLYLSQRRYDEAEPLYLETLETSRRVLGDDHSNTLISMNNLGFLYRSQGRYDEAEPLLLRSLQTRRRLLGDEHPSTLSSMNNLAILHKRQGRSEEAEALLLQALETLRRVLGTEHPNTLNSMFNLTELYKTAGMLDDARPVVAEMLTVLKRLAEAPNAGPKVKNNFAWMALTCEPADLRDSGAALKFALEGNEMSGFKIPSELATLAVAYHRTGDTAKAVETQRKALALLPEGGSRTAEFKTRLAEFETALVEGR